MSRNLARIITTTAALILAVGTLFPGTAEAGGPYSFYAVTPCRLFDTRVAPLTPLTAFVSQNFTAKGVCGIPAGAQAVSVNITITMPSSDGYLTIWPAGTTMPLAASINFAANEPALGNGALVPLGTGTPDISILYGSAGGTVDVIGDVTGYFMP